MNEGLYLASTASTCMMESVEPDGNMQCKYQVSLGLQLNRRGIVALGLEKVDKKKSTKNREHALQALQNLQERGSKLLNI